MIESQRLHFIRGKQHELRCDTYQSLQGMQSVGNTDVSTAGQRVILPSSFTGGARYMMQNYLDAMCLCRWFGYPDFFITITCNPNWPKVKRFLKDTTLKSKDRPDILCRLFKVKLDAMINLVKDKSLFGKVQAVIYTIEFQKRGLPHAHICIFMHPCSKIHNPQDVDKFITAEIPNKDSDPDLYKLVSDHMIHGPCGDANPKCTCMVNKKCSKSFPKMFNDDTAVDSQGFPCNQDGSIKYLFKYINKGPDRATISLVQNNNGDNLDPNLDEIKAFYDCRYISAYEATWRIFSFDVHYRIPSVMRLAFHLPGEQQFECNKNHDLAKTLTYAEFPTKYVWKKQLRKWEPRQRGFAIGRVHAVPPAFDEAYYLRILLNKVIGPECFEDIRTVDGVVCETFRDACYKRGLLDDDKEYIEAIEEAIYLDLILFGKALGLILNEELLKNLALLEIENFLISNNSSLRRYQQMPFPDMETISRATNPLMVEELSYDTETMNNEFNNMTLNDVMNGDFGNTSDSLLGGKVVVFCGDFRQILPVVTNGTRSECVTACINSSYIWSKCKVLKLTKNMRLTVGCRSTNVENIREFADWLLDIGQGNVGGPNDGQSVIDISDDLLILNSVDPMGDLISFDQALLAPLNEVVQEINERMLAIFPGEEVEYLSSDSLAECEDVSEDFDPQLYSPDLLNGLKISGIPNHRLVLKVGVPIMLLRNINHKKGLCNGTRLQVVSLGRRVIEAKVVSGTNIGYQTLISRVSLTPTDKKLPFRLKRRQFPISVCFSMTINKSQGQSLSRVGLYLKDPVFSHGQLYVALSRVKSRDGIKLVILDKESKLTNKTTNVVYKEIFGNVE
ncbi:uncharacterized protein LOC143565661 [Bidens hawaiensis]|uniref:uncharacterized protein LOC143565661 n=1 Tax=Bidens hawaiensis TaxID=980011 RepID=UPI00404A6170